MTNLVLELLRSDSRRARFEQGVDRRAGHECWGWLRSRNSSGYGVLRVGSLGVSYTVMAHRAAWMLAHNQAIPDGMVVDHACGNRGCCNPAHLEAITQTENIRRGKGYRAGDGEVLRCGPVTIRPRGQRFMAIWREYLDNGSTRQRGRTFDALPAAQQWATSPLTGQPAMSSGQVPNAPEIG